jgi:hypothetical protein
MDYIAGRYVWSPEFSKLFTPNERREGENLGREKTKSDRKIVADLEGQGQKTLLREKTKSDRKIFADLEGQGQRTPLA